MFKGGSLWAGLISGALAQLKDTHALTSGDMNKKDFAIETSKNITGSLGIMAGAEYGAVLGSSILPGAGTIIGGLLGSILGHRIGHYAGHHAGHIVFNNKIEFNTLPCPEKPKLT